MDGEPVVLLAVGVLNGAVVDLPAGVVAGRSRGTRLEAQCQVALVGAEHHAVEVVDRGAVVAAGFDDAVHGRDQVFYRVEPQVTQRDERFDRLQLDLQPDRIAQCPIGIRKGMEEIGAQVTTCGYHITLTGQDVHFQHGLVRQAVAERRRLDAQPGDGPSQRDGLQLRHHQR